MALVPLNFVTPFFVLMDFSSFQEGNTAIHLAAKHGHTQVLDALKGHVTWDITSTKVYSKNKTLSEPSYKFSIPWLK